MFGRETERERREVRKEREQIRETESRECWVVAGTYTAPVGSGHSGWP